MSTNKQLIDLPENTEEPSDVDFSFLPIGATYRQPLGHYEAPCDVRSASDLPSRLYLGSLNSDSFQQTETGWSVRYEDEEPETYVDLQYKAPKGPLIARFTWKGIEGMSNYTSGADWKGLVQYMSLTFPESWEERAKVEIEKKFNARFIVRDSDTPVITGFPDGAFMTMVYPVPTERLHELIGCLNAIEKDATVATVVGMYVVMTPARIDYVKDRCPDVPDSPQALAQYSRNSVGLPCNELPEVYSRDDGVQVTAVHRWVYLVHVSCVFRDLDRVIAHCNQQGFVGSSNVASVPSQYPDGVEWMALILQAGHESLLSGIKYTDEARSRRVAYGQLLSHKRLMSVAMIRDISREEALRHILTVKAQLFSEPDVIWPEHTVH